MHIKTQPTGNGTEIVLEEYTYRDVTLKVGYESNGASIPRIFWTLYPPFYPDYKTASFVHDHLCKLDQYEKADRYFYELLTKTGVNKTTRRHLYKSVRLWHYVAYKEDNTFRVWIKYYLKIKDLLR